MVPHRSSILTHIHFIEIWCDDVFFVYLLNLENVVGVAGWGMVLGKSGIRQLDELVKVREVVEGCWGWIWQHFCLGGKPLSIVPLKQEIRYGIFRLERWGVCWGGWGFVQVEGWCGVIFSGCYVSMVLLFYFPTHTRMFTWWYLDIVWKLYISW